ncbi:MADS-box transcription factor 20 isoform X1 [Zea mays]|uniref:Agamous-like MADS-box protein AGL8 n=1 Tax=Zea mays TaxID=4577 RepID=C0PED6_MAIZE|eukprot:XP_008662068.1 MADS-box transcription factor 14 isoform X1 [Zea mays]
MGRGRGKVEVRRIENSVSRQVTFSKRRRGLAKKARELAVLCDADVALLVFSDKGRLHDFAAHGSMERILGRYERYLLCEDRDDVTQDYPEESQGNMSYDHIKLRSKLEAIKKSQRNLMGEQLESLTFREVQQLEHRIDSALRNVRSRKETFLMEQNGILEKEKAAVGASSSLHTTTSTAAASSTAAAAAALPNLNICPDDSDEPGMAAAAGIRLPWWMLQPSAVSQRQEQH